jgi:hypothetical protein
MILDSFFTPLFRYLTKFFSFFFDLLSIEVAFFNLLIEKMLMFKITYFKEDFLIKIDGIRFEKQNFLFIFSNLFG